MNTDNYLRRYGYSKAFDNAIGVVSEYGSLTEYQNQGDSHKRLTFKITDLRGEQLPMLTQAPSQAQSETSVDIQLALSNPLYCKTVQEIRDEKEVSDYPN
ncbi:hypothetical protein RIF29_27119 [Crotalaria pallida]|uniref:Uncharacterized protein n=1 Tax=Crotalaria pallida TaxID=3830 RepID=A0AAN9EQU4_CROPI